MTISLQASIETQVGILRLYHIDPQTIQTHGGFSDVLYRNNLDLLLDNLRRGGFNDARVVAVTADDGPLTHKEGAFLNYHLAVVCDGKVYDPLAREPMDVDMYASRVFPGENGIRLWEETAPRKYQKQVWPACQ